MRHVTIKTDEYQLNQMRYSTTKLYETSNYKTRQVATKPDDTSNIHRNM